MIRLTDCHTTTTFGFQFDTFFSLLVLMFVRWNHWHAQEINALRQTSPPLSLSVHFRFRNACVHSCSRREGSYLLPRPPQVRERRLVLEEEQ